MKPQGRCSFSVWRFSSENGNIGYIRFGNVAGKGFVCIGEPPDLERRFGFFGDKQNAAVLFQGEQRRGQGGIFVYDGFCVSSGIRIAVFQNRFGYRKRFLVVGKRDFFGDGRFFNRAARPSNLCQAFLPELREKGFPRYPNRTVRAFVIHLCRENLGCPRRWGFP